MISSKEFSSLIITVITRVIDNAATQSLRSQPEYHAIMLSFESICEDMNLDQELERQCYQILLRMTADSKCSWWKKVKNVAAYIPETVQKRYGKLIPTDTTDVHSVRVSNERMAHYKRSAALRQSISSTSSSTTTRTTAYCSSANGKRSAAVKTVRSKGSSLQKGTISRSSSSSSSSRSEKYTLHSSATVLSPNYLNPQYPQYSFSQRNEEDDEEILQLAGVLNAQTPGLSRRVQFNTDETSGLSLEDLEASTTRVDVGDSASAEMGVLMNENSKLNKTHGHDRSCGADGMGERMSADELCSPLAVTESAVVSPGDGKSTPLQLESSLKSPAVVPRSLDRQCADVSMSVDDISSPEHVLLSAASRPPPSVAASANVASTATANESVHLVQPAVQIAFECSQSPDETLGASNKGATGAAVAFPSTTPTKPHSRSVLAELDDLMANVKVADHIEDFNIKSSVKLLFLFQRFLTSHCLVHHSIHDHPFEKTAITSPSATSQAFDGLIASKRGSDVAERDGLAPNPLGQAINPIGTRALFLWYAYFSSLNEFVSSLFGREQWLRAEMKSYVRAHLCRVIFQEWCYYSGVMVHAREHCDVTLKRLGISRWVEFLYKKKQLMWQNRRNEETPSFQKQDADIFHHSRTRHFNISPDRVHKLSYADRRPPRKPVISNYSPRRRGLGTGLDASSPTASAARRESGGGSGGARVPGSGLGSGLTDSLRENGRDDDSDDEITSDRFAHLFQPSKVQSSSLMHSGDSQQFQFLNSLHRGSSGATATANSTGKFRGASPSGTGTRTSLGTSVRSGQVDRDFIRRHWSRCGIHYSKEGWLFQMAAFRRLFKRTVIYHKFNAALSIKHKGVVRRIFACWSAALARMKLVNDDLDVRVIIAGSKLLAHRQRRVLRILLEHKQRCVAQHIKDDKVMQDLLRNPIARKAARFFQCTAYVKCFNCLKQHCAEQAPSRKEYGRADKSHARSLYVQGFRQWRYYLEVSQRLLVEQQLKQLNRLRLFGLKSSILTSANLTSGPQPATGSHHLMEPLSASSSLSTSLSSRNHDYEGEIDKILHPDSSVSHSTLRRQHPLLWQEYNSMYSKIQSSYEAPVNTGARGGKSSGAVAQNKRNIKAIRDYLVLLTNRVGYLRALRKLKKYSILPRLYYSPVDMIKSELDPSKNSAETRRAKISFREKGSCRYFNTYFERVQAQQIAMFRKEKFGRSSGSSGKDIFSVVGYGIPSFEYTSCVVLANARPYASSKSSAAAGVANILNPKKSHISSKQTKSFKLQIKGGNSVYSTIVTPHNPYLQYLYESSKNGQHGTTDDVLQNKQKMNSLFVRDASNGVIVTASSLYIVQFRRFVQNVRLNVSLRRRTTAVRSYFMLKYHAMYWKLWRNAYLDLKRFRVVLAERCFRTFRGTLLKRRCSQRIDKKASRAYLLGHWKRFKHTVKGWMAERLHNKQKFVRTLCSATYSKKRVPDVVVSETINPITGEPMVHESKKVHAHPEQLRVVSIKRLFPATKEKIELYRRLHHYLEVCNTRASVSRRFHRWSIYAERKALGNSIVAGLHQRQARHALHKLRRAARHQIAQRVLKNKVYLRCMRHWRVLTLIRITRNVHLRRVWHSWRLLYLKNLAGRVWFRPIYERQKSGWDRWVKAVKALHCIEAEVVEHLRLSRMHQVLYQWAHWRKAVIMSKQYWNRNILRRFSDFAFNSKVHCKQAELRGSFHHLRFKFHRKRSAIDKTLKYARSALHHLVAKHNLSLTHLHGPAPVGTGANKTKNKPQSVHLHHLNRIKASKLLMKKKFQLVSDTILLKSAFVRFRRFDKLAVGLHEGFYIANQHRAVCMAKMAFKHLKLNILRATLRKQKRKRDAMSAWRHRHLLDTRMCQFEDVAIDYHDARRLKLSLRIWLEKTQCKHEAVKVLENSQRYRRNRVVGIALLYLRSIATLMRKKEKRRAQEEWVASCSTVTLLK